MMHDREKSDSAIVAGKPTNKAVRPRRSRWSEGRGPRGTRTSKARTGHRTGSPCHRRWSAYGASQDGRFAVTHPRWEPCAGILPARIWAGGGQ